MRASIKNRPQLLREQERTASSEYLIHVRAPGNMHPEFVFLVARYPYVLSLIAAKVMQGLPPRWAIARHRHPRTFEITARDTDLHDGKTTRGRLLLRRI